MRDTDFTAGGGVARLRRRIAEIEAHAAAGVDLRTSPAGRDSTLPGRSPAGLGPSLPGRPSAAGRDRPGEAAVAFAIPRLDGILAGGLRRGALHEMRCAESRDAGVATGFAAAILARLARQDARPILWVAEAAAMREAGGPYGAGLCAFGLDPGRLIVVGVDRAKDALWVFEEGLRCRGVAAVLTEIRGEPRLLDLTASRRLALRAAEHGVMGLLVRQSDHPEPSAAATRWLVAPQPAAAVPDISTAIGAPAWRLTLERNRRGATGAFDVEWNHVQCCFLPLGERRAAAPAAHPGAVAAHPADRPAASPEPREIVALPIAWNPEGSRREIRRRIAQAR